MLKRCKCKKPEPKIIGNCEVCSICHGLIYKVRTNFYRKTSVKPIKNKYNRAKTKRNIKKEIEDDSID